MLAIGSPNMLVAQNMVCGLKIQIKGIIFQDPLLRYAYIRFLSLLFPLIHPRKVIHIYMYVYIAKNTHNCNLFTSKSVKE